VGRELASAIDYLQDPPSSYTIEASINHLLPDVFAVCLRQNKIIGSGRVFLGQEEYNGSSTH
jgi:hypothetical protein